MGGLTLTETAGDLAIAAAICSSFLEYPIPKGIAFIGEIGLSGELRTVPRIDKRVHALAKLGYKTCVVPKQAVKALGTEDTVTFHDQMTHSVAYTIKTSRNRRDGKRTCGGGGGVRAVREGKKAQSVRKGEDSSSEP
ncbi:hypothetical protein KIW84_045885 [Lathyrus oleraceus]|uniref:DNA repair protein RadA n=1 Tax=Pisum sativum TaxID=3888 RepID=A0A9D5ASE4_PEA|nr:hypothetical protein KIW84_045885 [Pisum sativum]